MRSYSELIKAKIQIVQLQQAEEHQHTRQHKTSGVIMVNAKTKQKDESMPSKGDSTELGCGPGSRGLEFKPKRTEADI